MRIFFAGTPQFSVPSLERLTSSGHTVCGVLTAPDKMAGRGNTVVSSPVKRFGLSKGLTVLTPMKLDEDFIESVRTLKPDILVVAAYGKIFKKEFLDVFPKGGINLHPSLLPRHRGPAPIPATIIAGDPTGGITVQKIALKMDSGDIFLQKEVPLEGTETAMELEGLFSQKGSRMLISVIDEIEAGTASSYVQDSEKATYCGLIKKEDGRVSWEEPASLIERKIRAYFPWPLAFTTFHGQHLVITRANIVHREEGKERMKPGYILGWDKNAGILVQTGKGILGLLRLQLQSKKEMDFLSFLNGHRDMVNDYLGEADV
ncbi:MAG: methionyl-tRNA formyltransferase [Spirochaetales bacterium]|nr:methionyl-tRNA formyltransferase [Spirochaetales bacterium]